MNKQSERRLVENELIYRQRNQAATKDIRELQKAYQNDGQSDLAPDDDIPLHFFCECADEKCTERILLTLQEYEDLHQTRAQLIVVPGHNVPVVERILQTTEAYMVVEKLEEPPKTADKLHPTELNHS